MSPQNSLPIPDTSAGQEEDAHRPARGWAAVAGKKNKPPSPKQPTTLFHLAGYDG